MSESKESGEDFRIEIERRFKKSVANNLFIFPKRYFTNSLYSSSDSSIDDMSDVSVYDLRIQNYERELKENGNKNEEIESLFDKALGRQSGNKIKSDRCTTVGGSTKPKPNSNSSSSKNLREIRPIYKVNTAVNSNSHSNLASKAIPSSKREDLQRLIKAQLNRKTDRI